MEHTFRTKFPNLLFFSLALILDIADTAVNQEIK